jgi:hypothetical protein
MVDIDEALKNFVEAVRFQSQRTHAGVAIAAAAILDSQLEQAIKRALRPMPQKLYDRLFDSFQPLGSFSSKIIMACSRRRLLRQCLEPEPPRLTPRR